MKNLFIIIITVVLLAGCSRAPIRPDVEGFWKLRYFTLVETGETVECSNLYYSITNAVTQVSEREGNNGYGSYVSRTEYRDNETKLALRDFKVSGGLTADTGEDAPVEDLRHYGIDSQEETVFEIVKCKRGKMTLRSDYAEIVLEKF